MFSKLFSRVLRTAQIVDVQQQRRDAHAAMTAARKMYDSEALTLNQKAAAAELEIARIEAATKIKIDEQLDVLSNARRRVASLEHAINNHEMVLRRTSSHQIDVALSVLTSEHSATLAANSTHVEIKKGPRYGERTAVCHSNHAAVMARIDSIRTARAELEALRLRLLTDDQVEREIETIFARIPAIETLIELKVI